MSNDITYMVQGFKTLQEAKEFTRSNGYGVIYSGLKGSKTKAEWHDSCVMAGIDPAEYPVTVNWNHIEPEK